MMFNSIVFHVACEFVAVEGWNVVSFWDVGISESAKNCVNMCITLDAVRVLSSMTSG